MEVYELLARKYQFILEKNDQNKDEKEVRSFTEILLPSPQACTTR